MIRQIRVTKKNINNYNKYNRNKKFRQLQKRNKKTVKSVMSGGGSVGIPITGKEKFEVKALGDMDLSVFETSKYIDKNIDWGIMGGAPPMDCVIL